MYLTRWKYTKEEWLNFLHWKTKEKGMLFFLFQKLKSVRTTATPEITISADRVWINNSHEPFQNSRRQFREIHIREAGNFNVLEIRYQQENCLKDIQVPIPKGKLKEAFEIQERITLDNVSVG